MRLEQINGTVGVDTMSLQQLQDEEKQWRKACKETESIINNTNQRIKEVKHVCLSENGHLTCAPQIDLYALYPANPSCW
jgi:hypothetical protein